MKRAERRAHYHRLKKKRQGYHGNVLSISDPLLGQRVSTMPACSCMACGNPRKFWKGKDGVTIAERKALEDYTYELADLEMVRSE